MMSNTRFIISGILFAALWGTAGVANKLGLVHGQPLWMTNTRFAIAAALLLVATYVFRRSPLPHRSDWGPLMLYGFLVNAIYMTLFIYGIREASAGISTLAVVMNPLIINILTAGWYRKSVHRNVWLGLLIGITGVLIATWPLLRNAQVTMRGMLLLAASMLCYSIATVYYAHRKWALPKLVINAWQIFFGAVLMLPISFLFNDLSLTHHTVQYWGAVLWLAIPVTIIAVQLWLQLLSHNPSKASLWLFLCPVFGFIYARFTLGEPITLYTVSGTTLVLAGLYMGIHGRD